MVINTVTFIIIITTNSIIIIMIRIFNVQPRTLSSIHYNHHPVPIPPSRTSPLRPNFTKTTAPFATAVSITAPLSRPRLDSVSRPLSHFPLVMSFSAGRSGGYRGKEEAEDRFPYVGVLLKRNFRASCFRVPYCGLCSRYSYCLALTI